MATTGNLFRDIIQSQTQPIKVGEDIHDATSTEGMTPRAMEILQASITAAAAAGLTSLDVVAGKGGGHLSHAEGTEWDLVGRNADGSIWTNAQRVAVADGARQAGADRFGLYEMDKGLGAGTVHIGYSGNGRPAAVWGADGLTSGAASQQFKDPSEKAFLVSYQRNAPLPSSALSFAPTPALRTAAATSAAIAAGPVDKLNEVPRQVSGQPLPNMRDTPQHDGHYNTFLQPDEEAAFRKWKAQYAPNDSGEDYDLRGAFKAGLQPGADGHWPDTFKKPNHPTFSDQSIYAKEQPQLAGHWEGDRYVPPAPPAGGSAEARAHALEAEMRRSGYSEADIAHAVQTVRSDGPLSPTGAPSAEQPKPNLRAPDLANAAAEVFTKDGRIRKGAEGDAVKEIQHFLNQRGATDAEGKPLEEDGKLGTKTRQAVKDYQQQHPELVADGVVGPRTMTAMIRDSTEMQQQRATGDMYNGVRSAGAAVLASLAVTDPISAAIMSEANRAGVAAEAAALIDPAEAMSPAAVAAAQLGTQMAAHTEGPRDYVRSGIVGGVPEFGTPTPVGAAWPGAYSFHPGENRGVQMDGRSLYGFDPAQFEAFNSLNSPHDVNPYTGARYIGSGATIERDEEIGSAAISAYARRLRDGPPSLDQEDTQPVAETVLFPTAAEHAGHGAGHPPEEPPGDGGPPPPPIDWNPPGNDPGPVYTPPDPPPPDPDEPVWV